MGQRHLQRKSQQHGRIQEQIEQINRDMFKGIEAGSGLHEEAIHRRCAEMLRELLDADKKDGLIKALWARVDNKERGGLDYTIELIRRIKDRLDNPNTGIARALEENAKWFSDLSGHLRNEEVTKLQEHLNQAVGQWISAQKQSEAKLKQIAMATRLYVRYHLYAAASKEAAELVRDLSDALGKQQGTDAYDHPIWAGFIGELEAGRTLVRNIIAAAENQIARTEEAMKQEHALCFVLPAPQSRVDELALLPPATARQWAEEAFNDFGGTQKLFGLLGKEEGRVELLGKLRNRALKLVGDTGAEEGENPLFAALDAHKNLNQLFADFMTRAMPWVAANVEGYLKPRDPQDQYKCFIGVKNAQQFEAKYGALLVSRLPAVTKMTPNQIGFVEIDTPGKLVCYTELTGLPLPSLRALDEWYASYLKDSERIPVHTHKLTSTFVHVREMTLDELSSRFEDFKLFVQAVALGVLTRASRGENAAYCLKTRGRTMFIGNEKLLRMNGLSDQYRAPIEEQVGRGLEKLSTDEQLSLWVSLLERYVDTAYPQARLVTDGVTEFKTFLPTLICKKLLEEYKERLDNKAGPDGAKSLLERAREALTKWTDEVADSKTDPYPNEVNQDDLQDKRVLKPEVFTPGWSLDGEMPPPPSMIPPYHVASDGGKRSHPEAELRDLVADGKLTPETKVWKKGMPAWVLAKDAPDLAELFETLPPLDDDDEPPPPPPPDGA